MPVLRRSELRIFFFIVVGLVAVGVAAALAFARGKPIGSGVVVIDTNLAYEGGAAAGSGMVLTSSGTVLTNNHVIAGATSVKVVVPNTRHSYTARVVGYGRTADVAVLRLQGASNLKTISVASSSAAVGEPVRAVGNAGGTGNLTSARGTITGLDRSIVASDEQGSSEQLTGLLETNAGVQPGDSGGPLLDTAGRVVGMDTAASASSSYASESPTPMRSRSERRLRSPRTSSPARHPRPFTSAPRRSSASRSRRRVTATGGMATQEPPAL